ncbi:radical SAM protein [Phaeobacter sp. J2-8]|uniref:radical SAM protein n=1 Tax=Phaeobacter sp. J2-8 TaxID=2931394 RepID=UPI001FD05E88|nr:radical SAM protein [Phaeobacter sp. J2-8]MCJ7871444.1 radical SAM protein [Phaeobacter sp. J2-8]
MLLDLTRHNRKDKTPSRHMTPADGTPRFCPWIEDSMTILSDGTVTCGLDDSDGLRSFGSVHEQSLPEIFANPEYQRLRDGLKKGQKCRDCALYQPLTGPRPQRPRLPRKLVVEPTVRCNLRCPQSACFANNSRDHKTRDSDDLPRDVLDRALAQLGDGLEEVYFFNYGDPFMHRDAPKMIGDIRRHSPGAKIVTSTNGIPLAAKHKAQQVVESGLDHIVFTISGMTQDSYARYHVNGRLESALRGMRNVVEARRAVGTTRPHISWRYLGFRWTDGFDDLDAALELAEDLGINDFSIYLTHIPEDSWSYRLAEGSYGYSRYRPWINVAYGYNRPPAPVDGLFPPEDLPKFGRARWTNWHGRPSVTIRDGKITFSLSTNSPAAASEAPGPDSSGSNSSSSVSSGTEIFLRTPWRRLYKITVPYCAWGNVTLDVPTSWWSQGEITVDLFCPNAWFPADWLGVEDYRCLGVLIAQTPGGTLPQQQIPLRPASFRDCHAFVRLVPPATLVPVASALFHHKTD